MPQDIRKSTMWAESRMQYGRGTREPRQRECGSCESCASGTQAKFLMGTRKFARDDHHHLEVDAHLDAAAVTPFRALLCLPTHGGLDPEFSDVVRQ